METWWHNLNLPLQIFYAVGVIAAILLLLEVLLTLFGLDHHNIADGVIDHPDNLGFLSIRTITGFFFGFGWTGVIALKSGASLLLAILAASLVGILFLFGIYLLMRALLSLRASGNLDYKNAIGQSATVYVTIPPRHTGAGQIEILIQSRLATISSMTRHEHPLAPGSKVRVIGLVDQGTLEVAPL